MMSMSHEKTSNFTVTQSSTSLTHLIVGRKKANKPIGIRIFGLCLRFESEASKRAYHQGLVLLLTFIAYTAFHMGRRPLSVVKNVLNRDCSRVTAKNVTSDMAVAAATTILVGNDHLRHANVILSQPVLYNYDYEEQTTTTLAPQLLPFITQRSTTTKKPSNNLRNHQTSPSSLSLAPGHSTALVTKDTSCDWAPFNDDATANRLLAVLDTSFLLSYAIFMFFSGFVAERTNLRYFISIGSLVSGLGLIAFGMSYQLDIHSMVYFISVQIVSGAAQSTGWPVVVTCVSNWFDRAKLGTIYGLWNSHTNLGNILGATIAGYFVESDWGLSFIVPGILMILVGVILLLFLVPTPEDVGLKSTVIVDGAPSGAHSSIEDGAQIGERANARAAILQQQLEPPEPCGRQDDGAQRSNQLDACAQSGVKGKSELELGASQRLQDDTDGDQCQTGTIFSPETSSIARSTTSQGGDSLSSGNSDKAGQSKHEQQQQQQRRQRRRHKPIPFTKAVRIPGVIEYSFCLFFAKLVSYTFLYWLPRYITSSTLFNSQDSAYLSTPFDVGGIAGSILAGWLSDKFKVNGIICNIMLLLAIPSMLVYQQFGAYSSWHNILLQLLVGSLVNGPYCLITTAVSADLGNRIKDGQAMATVSAIIDGMGSLGAVVGPLFAGFVSSNDWRSVFLMLMMADVFAALCIIRVTVQDVRSKLSARGADHLARAATPADQNRGAHDTHEQ